MPALVPDQPSVFQFLRDDRNSAAPGAQHHSEKFVYKKELVGLDAVVRHQQPTAAALFDGMEMIASRRLGDLIKHDVNIAKHDGRHRRAGVERVPEDLGRHAQSVSGDLHIDVDRPGVISQDNRQPRPDLRYRWCRLPRPNRRP